MEADFEFEFEFKSPLYFRSIRIWIRIWITIPNAGNSTIDYWCSKFTIWQYRVFTVSFNLMFSELLWDLAPTFHSTYVGLLPKANGKSHLCKIFTLALADHSCVLFCPFFFSRWILGRFVYGRMVFCPLVFLVIWPFDRKKVL